MRSSGSRSPRASTRSTSRRLIASCSGSSRDGHETNLLIAASRVVRARAPRRRGAGESAVPSPFCEELRRLLMPGRIVGARTLPHDAVLVLDCEVRGGGRRVTSRRLVAELFGVHPNILVVGRRRDGSSRCSRRARAGAAPSRSSERYVEPPARPEKELAPKPPFVEFGPTEDATLSRSLEESRLPPRVRGDRSTIPARRSSRS